jgi:glycosyltransferase involved in cell wall biosynthesis
VPVVWVGQHGSRLVRLARIVSALRGIRPDVIQSQHFYTNLYVAAAARVLRLREIGAMRNDGFSEIRATGFVMGHLSLRAPRVIAANSRAAIRNAVRLGARGSGLHLLPNVVDCEHFQPRARRESGAIRLVTIGRLVTQKRVDRFLSLLARLRTESDQPVRGIVVGSGLQRAQLERQAVQLGLAPDLIEFRGTASDMRDVYAQADIVVLTSDWEGTPNVLLEAMASGLPVVATSVGGVPDIVQDGDTGYLAAPGDDDAFVGALIKLIRDPELKRKMGCRARQHVQAHFSVERLPELLSRVYEAALS